MVEQLPKHLIEQTGKQNTEQNRSSPMSSPKEVVNSPSTPTSSNAPPEPATVDGLIDSSAASPAEPAPSLRPVEESVFRAAIEAGAEQLRLTHWDGSGCGTDGTGGCSRCYGPSPADASEVAEDVLDAAWLIIAARLRAAEETLAAVGALAEKLLHAAETGGLRQSLVAQAVAADLCVLVNQGASR